MCMNNFSRVVARIKTVWYITPHDHRYRVNQSICNSHWTRSQNAFDTLRYSSLFPENVWSWYPGRIFWKCTRELHLCGSLIFMSGLLPHGATCVLLFTMACCVRWRHTCKVNSAVFLNFIILFQLSKLMFLNRWQIMMLVLVYYAVIIIMF